MIKMRHFFISIVMIATGNHSLAHFRLANQTLINDPNFNTPIPRINAANDLTGGLKDYAPANAVDAPCGEFVNGSAVLKGLPLKTYSPGQVVKIEFEETINHDSRYDIDYSTDNDATFVPLLSLEEAVLVDEDGMVGGGHHTYTTNVTMPSIECNNCTFRMRQFMKESNTFYYACADIRITANPGAPPVDPPPPVVVPPPGAPSGESSQSSTSAANDKLPAMNACGFISSNFKGGGNSTGLYISLVMSLLFFPLVLLASLRLQRVTRRRR